MPWLVRVETHRGNVITGIFHGIRWVTIRDYSVVCRVVGWQYIAIDSIAAIEYLGVQDA